MSAIATPDYTTETVTINGVDVRVFGGAYRPVVTHELPGHVTGWTKRHGARVTYAEPTCTCHRTGEAVDLPEVDGRTWIAHGEPGWQDRVNAANLAHVENVTAHGYMVRPAGGDRSHWSNRHRVNRDGAALTLAESGVPAEDIDAALAQIEGGRHFVGPDGTRVELAADRSPLTRDPLPL